MMFLTIQLKYAATNPPMGRNPYSILIYRFPSFTLSLNQQIWELHLEFDEIWAILIFLFFGYFYKWWIWKVIGWSRIEMMEMFKLQDLLWHSCGESFNLITDLFEESLTKPLAYVFDDDNGDARKEHRHFTSWPDGVDTYIFSWNLGFSPIVCVMDRKFWSMWVVCI